MLIHNALDLPDRRPQRLRRAGERYHPRPRERLGRERNGDSITLDNGDTLGPTTLTQGGGGPTAAVGDSDTTSVAGGRFQSLTVNQLLDGTNNTVTLNTVAVSPFDPVASDGLTITQGNGTGDVTTVSGVTTYGPGLPGGQTLPSGFAPSGIIVTQGNGSVGVGTAVGVNDSASVTNATVPGNVTVIQADAAANTPMYDTALLSGDTAGGSLGIVQGDAGGASITPGDQATITGSTSAGDATISQGQGGNDSAAVSNSTVGGLVSITQADVVANPAGDTAEIAGDTVAGPDSIVQGGANGDTAIAGPGTAGSTSITQLGGAADTATVNMTAVGGSVSVSQGDGTGDSANVSVNTVADGIAISEGGGSGDAAAVGPGSVGGSVSITQLGGDGDTAAISGLQATGGTNSVPAVISIGQGGGGGDTAAISGVNAPHGNITITQDDVGTSTVGDRASVLNSAVGAVAGGTYVNGQVTISQGDAPGDVALVQGGVSNDIAITQGDNVQELNGTFAVASDVAEINGTSVNLDITINQGTGTSTINSGYYVTAIGFDYLGLVDGDVASSPVTAGFETVINQDYANNQIFLGDPSNGSSFATIFLDAYTGDGGFAFVLAANTTVFYGPLTQTFSIISRRPGQSLSRCQRE